MHKNVALIKKIRLKSYRPRADLQAPPGSSGRTKPPGDEGNDGVPSAVTAFVHFWHKQRSRKLRYAQALTAVYGCCGIMVRKLISCWDGGREMQFPSCSLGWLSIENISQRRVSKSLGSYRNRVISIYWSPDLSQKKRIKNAVFSFFICRAGSPNHHI